MKLDSMETDQVRRRLLWSIPWLVVHIGLVVVTVVAVVVLARRGEPTAVRHVDLLSGALGVVATGALIVIFALTRHRLRAPTLLVPAVAAMFASNLCSFLAALPGLAAVTRPLNVAHGIFTVVALPLALGAAWQGLRLRRRAG